MSLATRPDAFRHPGREAASRNGWLAANRWLLARRISQAGVMILFASGPWWGTWIAKGTLASSMTFDILPLTDPLVVLQSLAARHWPTLTMLVGAALVLSFYALVAGRFYCAWVCPINPLTDLAAWTRRRLGLGKGWVPNRNARLHVLVGILVVSTLTGSIAWELVNPITTLHRALIFGLAVGLVPVVAIFLFDVFVAEHGWCGHLCPVGAFYGQVGRFALLRVSASGRARCDDCMDCFAVCPENHVISPALRGAKTGAGPIITSLDCTTCGRCADVCPERVFRFTHRFDERLDAPMAAASSPVAFNPHATPTAM
jgi:ferredoxin-type protein NapH